MSKPAPLIGLIFRMLRLATPECALLLAWLGQRKMDSQFTPDRAQLYNKKIILAWVLIVMATERPLFFLMGMWSVIVLPLSIYLIYTQ